MMGSYLYGKRVACVSQAKGEGVWAEYMVTNTNFSLPLERSVSLEQGAMSVVNPLTALALLTLAKKGKHKAFLQTAAASALGQMINRLCRREGMLVINIVRREAQVELLKQQGARLVLNSSAPNFDQQLHEVCRRYQVRLGFDAVAGPLTGQLLEAMPPHSKVTVYGGLSFQAVQADPGQLIFQDKALDGFWLTTWLAEKNLMQSLMTWRRAQRLLGTELKSEIRAQYPLQAAQKAVREYQSQMTGGKVLFRPDRNIGE